MSEPRCEFRVDRLGRCVRKPHVMGEHLIRWKGASTSIQGDALAARWEMDLLGVTIDGIKGRNEATFRNQGAA